MLTQIFSIDATLVFIFGLCIGSFLNVCIYRLPKNLTLLGRSFCPHCNQPIPMSRNVPLFSYITQLGKSACCKQKISAQYPIVELLTGLISLLAFTHTHSLDAYLIWFCLFLCPLIVVSVVDFQLKIIPDQISIPFIGVGLLANIYLNYPDITGALVNSLVGILVGGGSLFFIGTVISHIKKQDALGGGDIKLTAMFGAFLGWRALIFIFFISSILALIYAIVTAFDRRDSEDKTIPFGPFLSLGAMLALFFGQAMTDWYFLDLSHLHQNLLFPA